MTTLTLELNAKLQPMHRIKIFENKLEKALEEADVGEVVGGGTLLANTGEAKYCDIELDVKEDCKDMVVRLIQQMKLIPKGSKIICEETIIQVGQVEGLAIYLNGEDLPNEVYETNDINDLISCLHNAMNEKGIMYSWWEGTTETALYFYGASFNEMNNLIKNIVDTHPL